MGVPFKNVDAISKFPCQKGGMASFTLQSYYKYNRFRNVVKYASIKGCLINTNLWDTVFFYNFLFFFLANNAFRGESLGSQNSLQQESKILVLVLHV